MATARSLSPMDYHSDDSLGEPVFSVNDRFHKANTSKAVNVKEASDSGFSSQSAAARSTSDSASNYDDAQSTSTSSRFSKDSGYRSDPDSKGSVYISAPSRTREASYIVPRASRQGVDSIMYNDYPPSATPRKPLQRSNSKISRERVQAMTNVYTDPNCTRYVSPPNRMERRQRLPYTDRPLAMVAEHPYPPAPGPGYRPHHFLHRDLDYYDSQNVMAMGPPRIARPKVHTNPFTPPHSRPSSYETQDLDNTSGTLAPPPPLPFPYMSNMVTDDIAEPAHATAVDDTYDTGASGSGDSDNNTRNKSHKRASSVVLHQAKHEKKGSRQKRNSSSIVSLSSSSSRSTTYGATKESKSRKRSPTRGYRSQDTPYGSPHGTPVWNLDDASPVEWRRRVSEREIASQEQAEAERRARRASAEAEEKELARADARAQARAGHKARQQEEDERRKIQESDRARAPRQEIAPQLEDDRRESEGHAASNVQEHNSSQAPQNTRVKDQKAMLSRALQEANTAVLLDNAQNFSGALAAYEDACKLLQRVQIHTSGEDDLRKVNAIRATYTHRIDELKRLDPGSPEIHSLPRQLPNHALRLPRNRDSGENDKQILYLDNAHNSEGDMEACGQSESQVSVSLEGSQDCAGKEDRTQDETNSKKLGPETVGLTKTVAPATERTISKFGITQSSPEQRVDGSLLDLTETPDIAHATLTASPLADEFERRISNSLDDASLEVNTMDQPSRVLSPGDSRFETSLGSFFDKDVPKKDLKKALVLLPSHKRPSSPKNRGLSNKSTETDATRLQNGQDEGECSVTDSVDGSEEIYENCEVSMQSALDTAMNVVKNLLLQELLDYSLPEAGKALAPPAEAIDAPDASNASSRGSSSRSFSSYSFPSQTSNSQTPRRRKRTRDCGRDPNDDGDDSDSDDRPKKKNDKAPSDRIPHRRLKCPFHQRNPDRYTKAACRGEGFADMAKLKDHIKRVHTQPTRCPRCRLEMKSEPALSEHLEQEDCEKIPRLKDDRITTQLLTRLNFKKAPYSNATSVEEKWKIMFKVLFPDDCNIPSPYDNHGMTPQIERALAEALEEELTRELAPILDPIMTRIKERIPTIIENCRLKVMEMALSSSGVSACTPSTSSLGVSSSTSDSEGRISKKQVTSPTSSRCSGSSFEIVSEEISPEQTLLETDHGKQPQRFQQNITHTPLRDEQPENDAQEPTVSWLEPLGGAKKTTSMIDSFPNYGYDMGGFTGEFLFFGGFGDIWQSNDTSCSGPQLADWSLPELGTGGPEEQNNVGCETGPEWDFMSKDTEPTFPHDSR